MASPNGSSPTGGRAGGDVWFWVHCACAWISVAALLSPHTLVRVLAAVSLIVNSICFIREA